MSNKKYLINEVSEITGFSLRTIRYYVSSGIIESPEGRGRGGFYNDSHIDKLLQIKGMQENGMRLKDIINLDKSNKTDKAETTRQVWFRYEIVPGLEIHVRKDIEESERQKIFDVVKLSKTILKGNGDV
ncbi:MAG: MerR family transcriptional regulator [Nitrospirae bacterium]|uniref:MerR family transcriptional regulator n=1 Tax=Candidatus Magnetobacterium casense TaxID=1455061 RepID=UPI0006974417|nr:MerR family transcriptional regulator [Candidatus Magnetobacterium casensis]MBF0338857.1 MerR family transcriptional regulator [Nitrospirota bacterium]